MKRKNCKGAIEISFSWLFAIIAGIAIIFAAFYLSSKFISIGEKSTSVQTGKELQILFNPLETSFQSSQTTSITVPSETRINNNCEDSEPFGRQGIQIDQKNFNKWSNTNVNVWTNNRYIFSMKQVEGKKFYIFSKQFNFPFKVADLIFLTSENQNYCFKDAPQEIIDDISPLEQENIFFENCPIKSINVCFETEQCDVNVNYLRGYVKKGEDFLYFAGVNGDATPLMYAAIFSDKEVYECQIKRLSMRLKELSSLYFQKENLLLKEGCEDNLQVSLYNLNKLEIQNSQEFSFLQNQIDLIYENNNFRKCNLW